MEKVDDNLSQRLQAYITQLHMKKFNEQEIEQANSDASQEQKDKVYNKNEALMDKLI